MSLPAPIAAALARSDHRIVITGASGWLGRATLDLLHDALGDHFDRRVVCFGSREGEVRLSPARAVRQWPLSELAQLPPRPTLLLHFAFLTKDRAETMAEAEYRAANRAIRQAVLDALDPVGVEAVFVASSGAARFADDPQASPAMRLYGALKREDEDAFASWAEARGTRAAIARIFNLSGPHINKLGSYALSSFLIDALAGRAVTVRAPHEVWRGYVAIRELMALAFALLLDPARGGTRFDSGGAPVELGELAAMIGALAGVPVERAPIGSGWADRYLGDDLAYRALLARHGIAPVPLADQIRETADFLNNPSICRPAEALHA